jgi:hypothetical protein
VRSDRGIVDQDVDTAELGQCPRRHGVDLVLFGHIGEDRYRLDLAFVGCLKIVPSDGRIAQFRTAAPSPDWGGVWSLGEK